LAKIGFFNDLKLHPAWQPVLQTFFGCIFNESPYGTAHQYVILKYLIEGNSEMVI